MFPQKQEAFAETPGQVAQDLIAAYHALGAGREVRRGMDFLPDEIRHEMAMRAGRGRMLVPVCADGSDLGIPRHDPTAATDAARGDDAEKNVR